MMVLTYLARPHTDMRLVIVQIIKLVRGSFICDEHGVFNLCTLMRHEINN